MNNDCLMVIIEVFFRVQFCQRYSSRQWDCHWVTNAVLSGSVFHWEGTIHKSRWKKSGLTGIYFHKFAFYLDSFSELCSNDSIILCFQIPSSSLGAPLHATPVSFFFLADKILLVLIIVHKFVTEVLVWLLGLQVDYPEIAEGIAPRHRFMSAYEQRIEPPDKSWQYLLFAAEPYETIAFKVCH